MMFSYVDEIIKCAHDGLKKPEDFGYWGYEDTFVTWGFCGIDKHNGSNVLDKSNFEFISNDLMKRFPDDFRIESFSHWVVGSLDRLVCKILNSEGEINKQNITESFRAAMVWQDRLQDYPVADESSYYDELYNDAIETIKNCISSEILLLIDTSIEDWPDLLYKEFESFSPYDWEYSMPKDDQLLEAVFDANIWNKEEKEKWREVIHSLGKDPDIVDAIAPGIHQMKLFGDNNE